MAKTPQKYIDPSASGRLCVPWEAAATSLRPAVVSHRHYACDVPFTSRPVNKRRRLVLYNGHYSSYEVLNVIELFPKTHLFVEIMTLV